MKILNNLINLITYKAPHEYNFVLPEDPYNGSPNSKIANSETSSNSKFEQANVFPSLDVNKEYIKKIYNFNLNSDIKLREFYINIRGKQYSAFLFYIEGMIDRRVL